MSQDELLRALGRHARESEARVDSRLDELVSGRLSAHEETELRRDLDATPEGRFALEAFRPLGQAAQESFVQAIARERDQSPGIEPSKSGKVLQFPAPKGQFDAKAPSSTAADRRRPRFVLAVAGAVALAAALILTLRSPAPLPAYVLEVKAGDRQLRSSAPEQGAPEPGEEVPTLTPGSRFDIVWRPATAVEGEIEVRAFLERQGRREPWQVAIEKSPSGSVRLEGEVGKELAAEAGEVVIWLVLGRSGELPDLETLDDRAGPFKLEKVRLRIKAEA